jgi:hypothetical protein
VLIVCATRGPGRPSAGVGRPTVIPLTRIAIACRSGATIPVTVFRNGDFDGATYTAVTSKACRDVRWPTFV